MAANFCWCNQQLATKLYYNCKHSIVFRPAHTFILGRRLCLFLQRCFPGNFFNGTNQSCNREKGTDTWPELWKLFSPQISSVHTSGKNIFLKDQSLHIFITKKNKAASWAFNFSPVYDDNGKISGTLVTCIDTTESVQAENKNEIKDLVLQAPVGICILEAATLTSEIVNDHFIQLVGKPYESIVGKNYWDTFSETRVYNESALEKVRTEGIPYYAHEAKLVLVRHGHEETVYVTFAYLPLKNDEGKVKRIAVYVMEDTTDVLNRNRIEELVLQRTTELEKAHQESVESNNYLQTIINVFNTPLQVLEPVFENGEIADFKFRLTNNAYAAYANTSPGLIQGKKVSAIFPGYFKTSSFLNPVKTFTTGIPNTWEIHYNVDGLDLYNEMTATKMGNDVILHFTDFTKLKHLQLELISKIEELERSNQNLQEFAHAASHDLKEPIRKIKVYIGLLKDELGSQLKEKEEQTFNKIANATERMGILVDDLLVYSQVSEHPLEKEPVDLNKKLQQVFEDLELDIKEKKATIDIAELPFVKGYQRQLQQMFQNLVSNALKYSKADNIPKIDITSSIHVESEKKYHLLEVKDNGIGFEQKHAEHIFQMFIRLHGKGKYNGTGIGLSIVKKVVENHGGMVKAESEPGVGTTFKIYLPVEDF